MNSVHKQTEGEEEPAPLIKLITTSSEQTNLIATLGHIEFCISAAYTQESHFQFCLFLVQIAPVSLYSHAIFCFLVQENSHKMFTFLTFCWLSLFTTWMSLFLLRFPIYCTLFIGLSNTHVSFHTLPIGITLWASRYLTFPRDVLVLNNALQAASYTMCPFPHALFMCIFLYSPLVS